MADHATFQPSLVVSRLRFRVSELEKDAETLTARQQRAQRQLQALSQEKQELGDTLARCKEAHAQESRQHAAEVSQLRDQVEVAQRSAARVKDDLASRSEELKMVLQRSSGSEENLKATCMDLRQQLQAKEEDFRSLQSKSQAHQQLVDAVEGEVGTVKAALQALQKDIGREDAHVTAQQRRMKQFSVVGSAMAGQLAKRQKVVQDLKAALHEQKKQHAAQQASLKSAEGQAGAAAQRGQQLEEEKHVLEERVSALWKERASLMQQIKVQGELLHKATQNAAQNGQLLASLHADVGREPAYSPPASIASEHAQAAAPTIPPVHADGHTAEPEDAAAAHMPCLTVPAATCSSALQRSSNSKAAASAHFELQLDPAAGAGQPVAMQLPDRHQSSHALSDATAAGRSSNEHSHASDSSAARPGWQGNSQITAATAAAAAHVTGSLLITGVQVHGSGFQTAAGQNVQLLATVAPAQPLQHAPSSSQLPSPARAGLLPAPSSSHTGIMVVTPCLKRKVCDADADGVQGSSKACRIEEIS